LINDMRCVAGLNGFGLLGNRAKTLGRLPAPDVVGVALASLETSLLLPA
jgi:hypothetical protein